MRLWPKLQNFNVDYTVVVNVCSNRILVSDSPNLKEHCGWIVGKNSLGNTYY